MGKKKVDLPLFRCSAATDDDDGECDGLPLGALGPGGGRGPGETEPSTKTETLRLWLQIVIVTSYLLGEEIADVW